MYLGYQNGKIKFYTETKLDTALYNIDKVEETQEEYIFDGEEYVLKDEAWEEKQAHQERERLDKLSMTRGDVFEALILARGLTKPQIRAMIENAELDAMTKALYLNRFDEALEFYRGYPIFDMLGQALGVTGAMLDKFFDTKDYHELLPVEDLYVENEEESNTNETVLPDEQANDTSEPVVEVEDENSTDTNTYSYDDI